MTCTTHSEAVSGKPVEGSEMTQNDVTPPGLENVSVLSPGQHHSDSGQNDLDPVGLVLYRVQTLLVWIDEHCAAFERERHSNHQAAECELSNLRNSILQEMMYLQRLSELILARHTINPKKRLPEPLSQDWFSTYVKRLCDNVGAEGK